MGEGYFYGKQLRSIDREILKMKNNKEGQALEKNTFAKLHYKTV